MVGFSGVIGSSLGSMLASMHGFLNLSLNWTCGKALTIYEGLLLAIRMELSQILVLSDYLVIIQMLRGSEAIWHSRWIWPIMYLILREIVRLSKTL